MDVKQHWELAYRDKDPSSEVSWYQTHPAISLGLIAAAGIGREEAILDVGGGASLLVDYLLAEHFKDLTVLDIAAAGLEHAQRRLGERASAVTWIEADITTFQPSRQFRVWHDRAVFHFLTDAELRRNYVHTLDRALAPGGSVILATFAKAGPLRCSGLPVVRYDSASLSKELGGGYRLVEEIPETHVTPWKSEQAFVWFRFERVAKRASG